jgi:hypothetical protein
MVCDGDLTDTDARLDERNVAHDRAGDGWRWHAVASRVKERRQALRVERLDLSERASNRAGEGWARRGSIHQASFDSQHCVDSLATTR